jgi:hypothetical protein
LGVAVTLTLYWLLPGPVPGETNTANQTKPIACRNTAPGVGYVGSKVCAGCHADIYETYMKTDMGRSMSVPDDPIQMARLPTPVTIQDEKLNRYFQVFRQSSNLYQSEYELAPNGNEVFRNTQKIEYVIGSGANGQGYIVRQGDYLVEAPLSYYSKPRSWALSPGYELGDYGFGRTVSATCIACHSGLPQPVPAGYGLYRAPPFRELAIGCENCHGPGQLHVEEHTKGVPIRGRVDSGIVNPAKLPGWLADNICMNCHQGGDTRVLQPDKDYLDFRPGTALDDTVAIFALPLTPKSPPASPLLEHYSLMILSKCYRASGGRMSCLTCHDPHQQPRLEAARYYRKRCLSCHTEKNCSIPLSVRNQKSPADDCAGCHMPKQKLTLISHSVLTNHRIVTGEGEPYPEAAFHAATPELPDLIHVNAIPGTRDAIPPLTLLTAYGQMLGSHPEYREHYLAVLNQLAQTEPNNPLVLASLAWKSMNEGTPEGRDAAIRYLSRAIELGSKSVTDYEYLASLLTQAGRGSEAIPLVERGIQLDPYNDRLYKALVRLDISPQRYTQALEAMKRALELFPEDDSLRSLVKKVEQAAPSPSAGAER